MWTGRLRYFGFGLLLLGLAGASGAGLADVQPQIFGIAASTVAIGSVLFVVTWDVMRQSSPESLAARGITPDDDTLRIMDPGLRREFSPMLLPSAVRRGPSASRGRVRSVSPPGRSRLPAAAPAAATKAATTSRRERTGSQAGRNAPV